MNREALGGHQCELLAYTAPAREQERRAAVVFEQWLGGSREAVRKAGSVAWLTRYCARHDHLARAEEFAREAAESYSHDGLETYAHLLDIEGRYEEADEA